MHESSLLQFCLITEPDDQGDIALPLILSAIKGGVTLVQLRAKKQSKEEIRQLAINLQAALKPLQVPLIINDHVDIAQEVNAAGVHLGPSDSSPQDARAILGPNKIIGWSVESWDQLEVANHLNEIDYIAASAVFSSANKTNCTMLWGLDGLKKVCQSSRHPVVAIGGISADNIESVANCGIAGIAVIGALYQAADPTQQASQLKQILLLCQQKSSKIYPLLKRIQFQQPLILNLSNWVTADFVANGLLCLGASPLMSQSETELEDLMLISKALVINIGTLDPSFEQRAKHAAALANHARVPIILDPVGAGASRYRTKVAKAFLAEFKIAIVRANASEIKALYTDSSSNKGVDSSALSEEVVPVAQALSDAQQVCLVMSGKTDWVIQQQQHAHFEGGSYLMPKICGTGCLLSAIVAAFHSIEENAFIAACAATQFYKNCAELAAIDAKHPAQFKTQFLDVLYRESTYQQGITR